MYTLVPDESLTLEQQIASLRIEIDMVNFAMCQPTYGGGCERYLSSLYELLEELAGEEIK